MFLKTNFSKLIIVICAFFSVISNSQCMREEENSEIPWVSSLNIKINGEISTDVSNETTLHSDRLAQWHISQAPIIADIYSNYQYKARNIAKGLFSVIYKNEENESFKIKHFSLDHIFINGWGLNDTEIINDKNQLKSKLHFHENDYPEFIHPNNFMTLEKILNNDENLANELLDQGVLPKITNKNKTGFHHAKNLFEELNKHKHNQNPPYHIKYLREKQAHAEKLILTYVYKNIEQLINNLKLTNKDKVYLALINIASYRDMCSECQTMRKNNSTLGWLLERIKNKINQKVTHQDEVNLKVICSGVTHLSNQKRPTYENSYSPVDILTNDNKVLYLGQNPIYPYALDYNTESKQYLTIMKNYLHY